MRSLNSDSEYFAFLDELGDSGTVNTVLAASYLVRTAPDGQAPDRFGRRAWVDKIQTPLPGSRRAAQAEQAFTFLTIPGGIFPTFTFQTTRESRCIASGCGLARVHDGRIRFTFSVHHDLQGGFA